MPASLPKKDAEELRGREWERAPRKRERERERELRFAARRCASLRGSGRELHFAAREREVRSSLREREKESCASLRERERQSCDSLREVERVVRLL